MNLRNLFSGHFIIDFYEDQTGDKQFYFLNIKSKNQEFEVNKSESFNSFSDLKKSSKRFKGIHLNINSFFVLTKIVPWLSDQDVMINGAFPNIDWDKFYFQIGRFGDKAILSLARKSQVEEVITSFESNNLKVKSLTLGVSTIYEVVPFTGDQGFETLKFKLELTTSEITEFSDGLKKSLEGAKIQVADFELNSYFLPGLSSFLGLFQEKLNLGASLKDRNKELKSNFKKDLVFKGLMFSSVSLLLIILTFNSFLYTNYYEDLNYYKSLNSKVEIEKEKWEQLEIKHAEKKALVENFYSTSHSNSTFLLNQIVVSVPREITLGGLKYQPFSKAIEQDNPIEIKKNIIILSGVTSGEYSFSEWIQNMERKEWVNEVEINDYQMDALNEDISFEIEIGLNE